MGFGGLSGHLWSRPGGGGAGAGMDGCDVGAVAGGAGEGSLCGQISGGRGFRGVEMGIRGVQYPREPDAKVVRRKNYIGQKKVERLFSS